MSWHLITMIVFSVLYLGRRIYCYSTSFEFSYYKNQKDHTKWELFWINIRLQISKWKYIIKNYWEWYKFKHVWHVVIAWLIYGGFFIW